MFRESSSYFQNISRRFRMINEQPGLPRRVRKSYPDARKSPTVETSVGMSTPDAGTVRTPQHVSTCFAMFRGDLGLTLDAALGE
jgi:hypothetical protein